jgi:hypothetical protein
MTPNAQTSASAPLYGIFLVIYGDINGGVPQYVVSICAEFSLNPKSIILTLPLSSTRIFSGFRSRWQIPFE